MGDLIVLLESRVAGTVTFRNDRLGFQYDDDWRGSPDAYPLSLSMPLTARVHGHDAINAFIWNLLPDNERTLDRWARQFQISARKPFALIAAVGEDCAGAVQFVRPERLDAARDPHSRIEWLSEAKVGDILRSVLDDAASGRTAGENGQFSLAGAQPKTALLREGDRWGIPTGRTPTTHILKPPARDMPGHAENEHFCLNLAHALGLRVARSEVVTFDGASAIVVRRYDRRKVGPGGPERIVRIHQEDMCQALRVLPWKKYQNDGGPSAADIVDLIRTSAYQPIEAGDAWGDPAQDDLWMFIDSLLFNWLIGGTDAHAKNYGVLLGSAGTVRLAPLYDIASAYALSDIQSQKMKLAMKIEYYLLERVFPRHWARWAASAGLRGDAIIARIARMVAELPGAIETVGTQMRADGLSHPVIERLEQFLPQRAARIAGML